jgi:predicted permease
MPDLRGVYRWLRALLRRAEVEEELDDEVRFHVEMQVEELIRQGVSPAEARRRALVAFGGLERIKEECRDVRGTRLVESVLQDLHYGLRGIRANPLFAASLVFTLGLGIGANAAMFSVIDALLWRPLPYGEPEGLVEVGVLSPKSDYATRYVPRDVAGTWREQKGIFEALLLHSRPSVLYTSEADPQTLTVEAVSPEFEAVLRVRPLLGRGIESEDAAPGAEPVAVLSYSFWRSAFGGDAEVLGKGVELEGVRHRVVGVMPRGFKYPIYAETALWIALGEDGSVIGRKPRSVEVLGRVGAAGVEGAQLRADARATALAEAMPREEGWRIRLTPLVATRAVNPDLRRAVWFLGGAVGLILLLSAINGVNLLLVRGWARTREIAVRLALGASRWRVARQLLTESTSLAVLSGVVAVVLALLVLRAIQGIIPGSITFFAPHAIEIERRTLAFTFAIAAAAGLLVGVVPALSLTRLGVVSAGAALTPYASRTAAKSRLRRVLVVGEVALSVVLLVGAGLMLHSFVRLTRVEPGFRVGEVAIMSFELSARSYPTDVERGVFMGALRERIAALPGVNGVTITDGLPPHSGFHFGVKLEVDGEPPKGEGQPEILPRARVLPDFFSVLGVPVLAGRAFTAEDAPSDNVIINEDLARFLWGEANPIGRVFRIREESPWLTVVGVSGNFKAMGPDDRRGSFTIFYPMASEKTGSYAAIAIRTHGDPAALLGQIRAAVRELDPQQPIQELQPAATLFAGSIAMPRFLMVLMATLSGIALVLASIGIYGVLASGVVQRRHEFGIRLALGARPELLSRTVLREGLILAGAGSAVGVAGALALSGLVRALLFGVVPTDPGTIAAVVAVGLVAAAVASYLPARRATRIDPAEVLRAE